MFSDVLIHADPFEGVAVNQVPAPPEILLAHCRSMTPGQPPEAERRERPRYDIAADVLVRPINKTFHPTGAPFRAVLRDVSARGLRLYHTRFVGAHLLAVRLHLAPGRFVTVAMTVLRTQARQGCYEIAGSILARLDETPDGHV
jgi:hypothetical protein